MVDEFNEEYIRKQIRNIEQSLLLYAVGTLGLYALVIYIMIKTGLL